MLEKIINKIMSARFLMAIIFTITYCLVEIGCLLLTWKRYISVEVFIAQFATFAVIMREIIDAYFKRTDRDVKPDKLDKTPSS